MKMRRKTIFGGLSCMCFVFFLYNFLPCENGPKAYMVPKEQIKYIYDHNQKAIPYDKNMPIIFIGGMPRSGTTLMRVMLDAHPEVRCGEETRVIPRILGMRTHWQRSETEKRRLNEAGITDDVIDSAITAFMLEVIAKHGEAAPRLCNKDPFTLKSSLYLSKLFPNSKFLFMIRDGRAVVHSIISRKVTITGFDLSSYRNCLKKWNQAMESMYAQCLHVGSGHCMPVYYEQLSLHPELWMKRILEFLDLPWNNSVLHHEDFVGKPGGISLSKTEKSSDQVIRPVNVEALSRWVAHIPQQDKTDMATIAPMLKTLGYDPFANPPDYGKPDPRVADNTMHIKQNFDFWKNRELEIMTSEKLHQRRKSSMDSEPPS
ncbi:protein-tyrosine sulfotransferase 1-like [Ylistrum balloti]|uniref:protein-tyrosine sulfotransferase 1-like n=1 Tax=Ylistrum balloti TaxID=509963 RepID=UPI0029058049|nr:protein-tyrosine sulfotransferase 1-like [Ylistrum balloti]